MIIPVLADGRAAGQLVTQLRVDPRVEVIVSSPDSGLESLEHGRPDLRVVQTATGRAVQMNSGAGLARGDWLLFLHADSRVPDGWLDALEKAAAAGTVGGWFRFALDDPSWQARLIERGVALRIKLFRLPYGDQGLFVRRQTFAAIGGYRDMPLMEDVDFVRRLTRAGEVAEIPLPIATSARRWKRDGWFRRSARNLTLLG
ncbi:MAG TPA: TIGR04283 family arsenosugar biosynthesis glycosyltransferase, partial [Vicinamibacterales bacterium]|nr:TIGR04283 family arsenosugar biosynthesis glycosyltransferase [Vicinamibacterales bacterium]